jgi:hypothetical protein
MEKDLTPEHTQSAVCVCAYTKNMQIGLSVFINMSLVMIVCR